VKKDRSYYGVLSTWFDGTSGKFAVGNLSCDGRNLYSYKHHLLATIDPKTGIIFINSDVPSRTTGKHLSLLISFLFGMRREKSPALKWFELSQLSLQSILNINLKLDSLLNLIEIIDDSNKTNERYLDFTNSQFLGFNRITAEYITLDANGNKTKTFPFLVPNNENSTVEYEGFKIYQPIIQLANAPQPIKDFFGFTELTIDKDFVKKFKKEVKKGITLGTEFGMDMFNIPKPNKIGWEFRGVRSAHFSMSLLFRSKVRQFNGSKDKYFYYYAGLDEGQYFISVLPKAAKTIDKALDTLKPKEVLKFIKATNQPERVLRQGEWFFVPKEKDDVPNKYFKQDHLPLLETSRNKHVCRLYKDKNVIMAKNTNVFHRNVATNKASGDHKKLTLNGTYYVYRNTELDSRSLMGRVD